MLDKEIHDDSPSPSSPPMVTEPSTLLELNDVAIAFGGNQALDGVSFEMATGDILGLIGPNGSGKTTLLNVIGNLYRTSAGTIYFLGQRIDRLPIHHVALRGLAQALRDECARGRVGVSIVNPGMVRTPFFEDLPIEPGSEPEEALSPVDVAAAVGYLLEQPPSLVVDEINLSPIRKKVHFKNRSP